MLMLRLKFAAQFAVHDPTDAVKLYLTTRDTQKRAFGKRQMGPQGRETALGWIIRWLAEIKCVK
jgi:hypothetical protein